jgi:hypothetical protein
MKGFYISLVQKYTKVPVSMTALIKRKNGAYEIFKVKI